MPRSIPLNEILDAHHDSRMENAHVCLPGKVIAYHATTQTVDVQCLVKRPGIDEDGEKQHEELPAYPNVQVAFPRAGILTLHFPVTAGSFGYLIFCDMPIGEVRTSGQLSEPQDVARHSGGYAIFLPGAFPDVFALSDAPTNEGYIGVDGNEAQVRIKAGEIRLGKTATDFVALASLVLAELQAIKTSYDTHTHPVGGAAPPLSGPPVVPLSAPGSVAATVAKAK